MGLSGVLGEGQQPLDRVSTPELTPRSEIGVLGIAKNDVHLLVAGGCDYSNPLGALNCEHGFYSAVHLGQTVPAGAMRRVTVETQ